MGREILYCTNCGKQLTAEDFTRGRAHTFDHRQYCSKCLPSRHDPGKTPPPRAAAKRAPSSVRIQPAAPPPKRSALPWILAVAAAGVFAAVLGLVLRPVDPPPEDPGRKVVEDAREFAKLNARNPEDVERRWERAAAAAGEGAWAVEAKRELDRARAARKEAEARELKELEEKVRERLQAEHYGAVFDVLEEARKRHDSTEWTRAVAARIQDVRATTERRYPELKAKAVAAHARGAEGEAAELRGKLALWGRKDLSAELEAELAKVVPKEAPPAEAVVLLRYPNEGPRAYNHAGTSKNGGLAAAPYGKGAVMGGFELLQAPFPIPEKGEFWLTYSTKSPEPIVLRFRVMRGDKTFPYNWTIQKPDVGRPARVKAPIREFMNYDHKYVVVGERVQSVYIQQDDPKSELTFLEALIFRLP